MVQHENEKQDENVHRSAKVRDRDRQTERERERERQIVTFHSIPLPSESTRSHVEILANLKKRIELILSNHYK